MPNKGQGLALLAVSSPQDLIREEREADAFEAATDPANNDRFESELANHVRKAWSRARRAKERPEQRMLENLRQRNGEYDQQTLRTLQSQGRSTIFMMLTAVKCRAAKAWIRDILMPAGDRPWDLRPTAKPDLPGDIEESIQKRVLKDADEALQAGMQITPKMVKEMMEGVKEQARSEIEEKAKEAIERMGDVIEDQLIQGGWDDSFDRFISDLVDFQAGILKGPVVRQHKHLTWADDVGGGKHPEVTSTLTPQVDCVDPFMIYPAPGIEDPQDGDMIELHRFTRSDLYELIGVEGYDEEAIRRVLRDHENGTLREWLAESTAHAIDSANGLDGRWENQDQIDALEFWGEVQGSILQRWGIDAMEAPDPEAQYPVRVMLVGDEVVAAEINTDPLGRKPYYKACFERVPGSFWGKGVPDLIADSQRVCNAAARALVDNMAVSSGPQVAVNTASLPPGEDVTQVFPWKIWQLDFNKGATSSQPPIQFFQPNPMTEQLMAVYERFSRMADDHSGIPAYTYGSGEASGAGSTASGLSMLMNAASKAIKSVISSIDKNVISRMVHSWYTYNMLYSDDDSIKGDADVVARGAMSLVAKEQVQMRRQEYLGMTANPADAVIIGPEERLSLHREIWKGLDMPIHDLPDEEELRERMAPPEQQGGPQGAPPGGPGGAPPGGPQQPAPAELDPAGSPAGGLPPVAS